MRLWRGPRLLVSIYLLYWHWSGVFRLWANEAFHRILIGDGRPWARNEHQWHFGEKCNYKFLNTTNRPRFCTKLIQSNLVIKQSRSNLVEMLDKSETVCSLSFDCPTDIFCIFLRGHFCQMNDSVLFPVEMNIWLIQCKIFLPTYWCLLVLLTLCLCEINYNKFFSLIVPH